MHFQVHPCGAQELLIDPLPQGAKREGALYPDGAHITDLKVVRETLYKMQRPAISPDVRVSLFPFSSSLCQCVGGSSSYTHTTGARTTWCCSITVVCCIRSWGRSRPTRYARSTSAIWLRRMIRLGLRRRMWSSGLDAERKRWC